MCPCEVDFFLFLLQSNVSFCDITLHQHLKLLLIFNFAGFFNYDWYHRYIQTTTNSLSDEFYTLFYLALYNEIRNDATDMSQLYMNQALDTIYAQQHSDTDYMVACAQVHAKLRNWR
jgi:hypothetical protein